MESDNFMKRFTSFLVPSFVANVLTPRRGGANASESLSNHHQPSDNTYNERQQSTAQAVNAAPALGSSVEASQPPVSTLTAATSAGFSAANERHHQPVRSRGLGGTSSASMWTSFDHGGAGGKRRFLDEDAGNAGSKRPRTLVTSPSSSSSPAASGLGSTSLFYPGRTVYGGGFNAAASRSIRATPLQTSASADAANAAAAAASVSLMQQPQLVTPTAKKILDALDRLSTPLIDARRMPSATSTFVSAAPPFRVAYRRRMQAGQAPPTRSQQGVGSGVGAAHDTFRTRGLLETTLSQSQQLPHPAQSEFQFSAPIFRGQRPLGRLLPSLPPPPQPSADAIGNWQCTVCLVTNAPGTTSCIACSVAAKCQETQAKTAVSPTLAAPSTALASSDSQWRCGTCMCTSPDSSQVCVICQAKRPAALTSTSGASAAVSLPAASDWRCDTCMCTSPVSSQVCDICKAKRPAAASSAPASTAAPPVSAAATSDWRCDTCMCTSPVSSQVCDICKAKRPVATTGPVVPPAVAASLPKRPSFIDSGPATAPIFSMFSQQQQQPPPPAKWQCNTCLVENPPSVSRCMACESPKPGALPMAPAAVVKQNQSAANSGFSLLPSSAAGGEAKITFGAPSAASSDSGPKITFGAPSIASSDSGPKITFGAPSAASSDSGPKITFGAPSTASSDSGPKITFGAPSTASSDSGPKIAFGASSAASSDSGPKIAFGASSAASSDSGPKISFGAPSAASSDSGPKIAFGAPSAASSDSVSKIKFGVQPGALSDSTKVTAGVSFGSSPSGQDSASSRPTFGIPAGSDSLATKSAAGVMPSSNSAGLKLSFGNTTGSDLSVPMPAFGIPATSNSASNSKFSFAATPAASSGGSAFQGSSSATAAVPAAPTFVFGSSANATSAADQDPTGPKQSKPAFNFQLGSNSSGIGAINNGSGGSLFAGTNGGSTSAVLFGAAKPNVDLDADPKPLGGFAAGGLPAPAPPRLDFAAQMSAAPVPASAFVFGSGRQSFGPQMQQPQLRLLQPQPAQQMLPSNGPGDLSNPFNPPSSANRPPVSTSGRSRLSAKRRLK